LQKPERRDGREQRKGMNKLPDHGANRYTHHGCRCEVCRRSLYDSRRKRIGMEPPSHGLNGYKEYGCRCVVCRKAKSDFSKPLTKKYKRENIEAIRVAAWKRAGILIGGQKPHASEYWNKYQSLFEKQGGVCGICGKTLKLKIDDTKTEIARLDHNHKTGDSWYSLSIL
jgi:hypothetical protein